MSSCILYSWTTQRWLLNPWKGINQCLSLRSLSTDVFIASKSISWLTDNHRHYFTVYRLSSPTLPKIKISTESMSTLYGLFLHSQTPPFLEPVPYVGVPITLITVMYSMRNSFSVVITFGSAKWSARMRLPYETTRTWDLRLRESTPSSTSSTVIVDRYLHRLNSVTVCEHVPIPRTDVYDWDMPWFDEENEHPKREINSLHEISQSKHVEFDPDAKRAQIDTGAFATVTGDRQLVQSFVVTRTQMRRQVDLTWTNTKRDLVSARISYVLCTSFSFWICCTFATRKRIFLQDMRWRNVQIIACSLSFEDYQLISMVYQTIDIIYSIDSNNLNIRKAVALKVLILVVGSCLR